jgi:hypothetical protein
MSSDWRRVALEDELAQTKTMAARILAQHPVTFMGQAVNVALDLFCEHGRLEGAFRFDRRIYLLHKLRWRFDDGDPELAAVENTDNAQNIYFSRSSVFRQKFLPALKDAQRLRVEFNFETEGTPIAEFHTAGADVQIFELLQTCRP